MAKKILMSGNKVITTSGRAITFDVKDEQEKIVDLSMASGDQVISPDREKVLSKITVNKPSTLIPNNIKKDVNIGGVVGTLESGTSSKIQPSKSLTITSNGTMSITPDAGYDALSSVDVTVNVASGGGGGAGYKVTFPATATNWGKAYGADLLLSDGTVKSFSSYSEVSGKTIENVVGIHCVGSSPVYVLTMTLSEGSMAQCRIGAPQSTTYWITTSNGTTMAFYGAGQNTFWWPLADTVISAIEMYNTD